MAQMCCLSITFSLGPVNVILPPSGPKANLSLDLMAIYGHIQTLFVARGLTSLG